jgi:hypothetical protein
MDPRFKRLRISQLADRSEDVDRDVLRHICGLIATVENRGSRTKSKTAGPPSESLSCLAVARLEAPNVLSGCLTSVTHWAATNLV